MRYAFHVVGIPVPKGRPRLGRGNHTYTPARTVAWENVIRIAFMRAFPDAAPISRDACICATVNVWAPGRGPRCKIRGDIDNYEKAVLDALQGLALYNDAQVVEHHGSKDRAHKCGGIPGVDIVIEEIA